jgi:hypothetical protein
VGFSKQPDSPRVLLNDFTWPKVDGMGIGR